ncbi:hypothetical protein J8L84_06925 [Alteromonas sp. MMG017]|uniref:hypothetical protein n=1 Tax=Alteromonas sp. MMG017 TaxID=2822692 RepID=UPI001B3A6C3E|nr:hypothetical protein [Alteromonas sp. MMG017]MBQ4829005.1 hypothetical protein [Alteromonas sp. MMG017]
MNIRLASASLCLLLAGCNSDSTDTQDNASSIALSMQYPIANANVAGKTQTSVVGIFSDIDTSDTITTDDISEVLVNGVSASIDLSSNRWEVSVPIEDGLNTITIEAYNDQELIGSQAYQIDNESISPQLESPTFGVLDVQNNRLLIGDSFQDNLLALDLNSNAFSVLSSANLSSLSHSLLTAKAASYNSEGSILYVASEQGVISINLTSGERTSLFDSDFLNGTPFDIAYDNAQNHLYVLVDSGEVLEIDLSSRASVPLFDKGVYFDESSISVWDLTSKTLYYMDNDEHILFSVDLINGAINELVDLGANTEITLKRGMDLTLNPDGSGIGLLALFNIESGEVVSGTLNIDLSSYSLSIDSIYEENLSTSSSMVFDPDRQNEWILDAELDVVLKRSVGSDTLTKLPETMLGNTFSGLNTLTLDETNNILYAADHHNLYRVDMSTGISSTTAEFVTAEVCLPPQDCQLHNIQSIEFDEITNHLIVLEHRENRGVFSQVELISGDIEFIYEAGSLADPYSSFFEFAYDVSSQYLYVYDDLYMSAYGVNRESGDIHYVFNNNEPDSEGPPARRPNDLFVDTSNNRLIVNQSGYFFNQNEVISVDLATGNRQFILNGDGDGGLTLHGKTVSAFHSLNAQLLTTSSFTDQVLSVNVDTGESSVLVNKSATLPLSGASDMVYHASTGRLFVSDKALEGIIVIDVNSGERALLKL